MTDNPLNAQQLAQIRADYSRQVELWVKQAGLRKWAVEQALISGSQPDIVAFAQQIYDFVIQPANIKIESE